MKQFWETTLVDPLATLGNQILALLPNILGMVIILSVGWAAAWLVGLLVQRLLHVIGLDRACDRLGLNAALARGGVKSDLSQVVGRAAYWIVLVFAAVAALSALNLQPIKDFAHSFLAYIPHLLIAMLILVAGYLLSNFLSNPPSQGFTVEFGESFSLPLRHPLTFALLTDCLLLAKVTKSRTVGTQMEQASGPLGGSAALRKIA